MPITHLMSEEEYLSTSYDPDCEYVEGEVLEHNTGESEHAGLQGILTGWFRERRKKLGIYVFRELRVQVASRRYRIPDILVITHPARGHILREPPFLCIEVLSPEDRASRMQENIDEYLNFGVAHVWLIDPVTRRAWSYTKEGRWEATEVLTTDDPKIELPLREIFAELDNEVLPE